MLLYFALLGPALLLSIWAQARVKSAYTKWSMVRNSSNMTGAEAAARMLHAAKVPNARIEQTEGELSDHYDPRDRTLRLSRDVYNGRSVASVGIACHEAGHAIQHAHNYGPMGIRSLAVPLAHFGGQIGMIMIVAGMMMGLLGLAKLGFFAFCATVGFQLVNLIVEFDASARAKRTLRDMGILAPGNEQAGVSDVLGAAALTYVAATLTSIATLLYYGLILFGGRRSES